MNLLGEAWAAEERPTLTPTPPRPPRPKGPAVSSRDMTAVNAKVLDALTRAVAAARRAHVDVKAKAEKLARDILILEPDPKLDARSLVSASKIVSCCGALLADLEAELLECTAAHVNTFLEEEQEMPALPVNAALPQGT